MSDCAARWLMLSLVTCAKRRPRLRYWMSEYENGKYYFFPTFSMVFPNLLRFYQANWQLKSIHRRFPFFIPRCTERALLTKEQNTIQAILLLCDIFRNVMMISAPFSLIAALAAHAWDLPIFSSRIQHLRRHCIRWALILLHSNFLLSVPVPSLPLWASIICALAFPRYINFPSSEFRMSLTTAVRRTQCAVLLLCDSRWHFLSSFVSRCFFLTLLGIIFPFIYFPDSNRLLPAACIRFMQYYFFAFSFQPSRVFTRLEEIELSQTWMFLHSWLFIETELIMGPQLRAYIREVPY